MLDEVRYSQLFTIRRVRSIDGIVIPFAAGSTPLDFALPHVQVLRCIGQNWRHWFTTAADGRPDCEIIREHHRPASRDWLSTSIITVRLVASKFTPDSVTTVTKDHSAPGGLLTSWNIWDQPERSRTCCRVTTSISDESLAIVAGYRPNHGLNFLQCKQIYLARCKSRTPPR